MKRISIKDRLALASRRTARTRSAVLALVLFSIASARADAPRALTFESAIELALGGNSNVAVAREAIASAEAKAAGQRAHRWATLDVNATGYYWKEPYALMFGGGSFVLHEQRTSATVVAIAQPLTGLAYLSELIAAADHQTAATRREYDRVRLDVAYHAADAYLHVLVARATADVAHHSVVDIQGGVDRAEKLRAAETYTDLDVLRFRSAKAAADQNALRADAAAQLAIAELVVQLGLREGTPIELADDLPAAPPPLAMTIEQAQARALSARPELAAAREQIAAADNQRRAARERYLPDVRAVAVWNHLTGVQPFQPEDEEYVGLTLSWNVWNWGATHHAVVDAEHAKARAAIGASALVDQVKLDVRRSWLAAKTAFDSLDAARTQQQTAEEAYRLTKVRFDNAAATTTDVLDSEDEVSRARLRFTVTRYDYYLALVALARSVGDVPRAR
jgi:outer membrane protein TolC